MTDDTDTDTEAVAVKLLPTDPQDMTPPAVAWAKAVLAEVRTIPRARLQASARTSLTAVTWTLAAAADWLYTILPSLPPRSSRLWAQHLGMERPPEPQVLWTEGWTRRGPAAVPLWRTRRHDTTRRTR
ncbi:hypothetical protein [Kineococcus radiotolerans]|nr:hypothetical protein [Kineococcus radiotolerans]